MSQEDFKKIIDSARQILVGKLPNPQDQIDAITYTMMYKFMNDIDDRSASLPGGKRTYFANDYEKYSWHNLMRADGQEQLILYREAIEKMSKNPGLPVLFREIFNGAMLKFNDPRTLRLFLKEMDLFTHATGDHIGDAYEYLLSLMSSQGGLGQFRTPRHIIKFIVDALDPDKNDKIMDPAVGTAGFLIAAYEHILHKHDGVDGEGKKNDEKRLSASELDKIHSNFRGFDIEPSMVRKSQVNMFLHGFKTPDIIEHDTLTSEDYWSDRYDVILANPPFMTPKGGIQPHKKFGVSSGRAEVLFSDYIVSHLKPSGKAGFVIPEGVLATQDSGFKAVRKEMLENGLFAVISLPVGLFNPYSPSTKTSIVFIDKEFKGNTILYINVESDGYSLGQDRHRVETDDLPIALEAINAFKNNNDVLLSKNVHIIDKSILRSKNDLRLDYAKAITLESEAEESKKSNRIKIKELFNIEKGKLQSSKNTAGDYVFVTAAEAHKTHNAYSHDQESIVFAAQASGSLGRVHRMTGKYIVSDLCYVLTPKDVSKTNIDFYFHYLRLNRDKIVGKLAKGSNKKAINLGDFGNLNVPNIPINEQNEINEINEIIEDKRNQISAIQNDIRAMENKIATIVTDEIDIMSSV